MQIYSYGNMRWIKEEGASDPGAVHQMPTVPFWRQLSKQSRPREFTATVEDVGRGRCHCLTVTRQPWLLEAACFFLRLLSQQDKPWVWQVNSSRACNLLACFSQLNICSDHVQQGLGIRSLHEADEFLCTGCQVHHYAPRAALNRATSTAMGAELRTGWVASSKLRVDPNCMNTRSDYLTDT